MQDQLSLSSLPCHPAEVFELMQFLSNPSLWWGYVETCSNFGRVVFLSAQCMGIPSEVSFLKDSSSSSRSSHNTQTGTTHLTSVNKHTTLRWAP